MSVSTLVAKTLSDAIKRVEPSHVPPFNLVTVSGTKARPGLDLDRPLTLDIMEDEGQLHSQNA